MAGIINRNIIYMHMLAWIKFILWFNNETLYLFTWGNMFRLYLLFIKTRTKITLVVMIPMESPSKQMNLVTFSNAIRVDGISNLFQTLSLLHDTFHTGVGWMMISFGMILTFTYMSTKKWQLAKMIDKFSFKGIQLWKILKFPN